MKRSKINAINYLSIFVFSSALCYYVFLYSKSEINKDNQDLNDQPKSLSTGLFEIHDLQPEEKDSKLSLTLSSENNLHTKPAVPIKENNYKHRGKIQKHLSKGSKAMFLNFEFEKNHHCENDFKLRKLSQLNETYDEVIIERHPNLPKFLIRAEWISSSIPDIPSIRWTGTVYQESWKDSPKFLLYSAHFDTRFNSSLFIHILSYYNEEEEESNDLHLQKHFCQIWFDFKDNPVAVPVYDTFRISGQRYRVSRLQPYVSSCKVPNSKNNEHVFPIAVSLVSHQCHIPESVLKISASPVKRPKALNKTVTVGICGKALYYYNNDFSTRLIEWVEILKILGASKIFLYKTECHENVKKVLDFYENEGIVKIITFHYPPPIVQEGTFIRLWLKILRHEYYSVQYIHINDCLLRNKDDFDYLGVLDSDEIPIMKEHRSLPDLFMSLRQENNEPESYHFKWKTFFHDLKSQTQSSNEMDRSYCFSHNLRTKLNSSETKGYETNGKTFYDTNQVVWATSHTSIPINSNLAPEAKLTTLPKNVAYMGHFTEDHICTKQENCYDGNIEEETALLPIREKVVQEMNKVLGILKI